MPRRSPYTTRASARSRECLLTDSVLIDEETAMSELDHEPTPPVSPISFDATKDLIDEHYILFPFLGKSTVKETTGEEKKEADGELWCNIEAQAAFLGPNLWDKTLTYESDFKEISSDPQAALQYVDLDEFLSENGITGEGLPSGAAGTGGMARLAPVPTDVLSDPPMQLTLAKRERSPSPSGCDPLSPDTLNPCSPADSTMSMASSSRDFDPRSRTFSDEELKPQPMMKKGRKQFVPEDLKDEKYWARRRKNNMAAKRSRDARRMKENQIALRAGFLEKENMGLRQELDRVKKENMLLRDKLSKYEG